MSEPRRYHLAQVNIARPLAPLDSVQLAGFVAALDPVNALADAAPGFVWRLQTEEGNATAVPVFGGTDLLVNMSVWESVDALSQFVFRTNHSYVMRQRRQWFEQLKDAYAALWWVPVGVRPTVADAEQRIVHLREHGPTAYSFTMRVPFPPPATSSVKEVPGTGEVERDAGSARGLDHGLVPD